MQLLQLQAHCCVMQPPGPGLLAAVDEQTHSGTVPACPLFAATLRPNTLQTACEQVRKQHNGY